MNHQIKKNYYAILVDHSCGCYAINVNLIKRFLHDLSPLSISTGNFCFVSTIISDSFSALAFADVIQKSKNLLFIMILVGLV
jgi:hypothetical protein